MSKSLKIVFMGTPEFAVASLNVLFQSTHTIVGVVTAPDKPAGRGQVLTTSAVKQVAVQHNLPLLQPLKLRDPEFITQLAQLQADLFVVVAFRMLPEVVWAMPPLGSINLHGSLLPQYRGAAPINWAIINGEKMTGVTTFFLNAHIDEGKIIRQTEIEIREEETAGELHDRMKIIGANALLQTVNSIAAGNATAMLQSEVAADSAIKHAPKIFREDCRIDWHNNAEVIHNLVRGLSPYPAAWTTVQGKTMKVFAGKKEITTCEEPGNFFSDGSTFLKFSCADGYYHLTDLQLEGKKRMKVDEFLKGWRVAL